MNYFCTLATQGQAGLQDRSTSLTRLVHECHELGLETERFVWDWTRFQTTSFYHSNRTLFTFEHLLGYWAWKPYIIAQALFQIDPSDTVVYLDSDLSVANIDLFREVISLPDDVIFIDSGWYNAVWTPASYYPLLKLDPQEYQSARHVWAAATIWREPALPLAEEYMDYSWSVAQMAMQYNEQSRYDQSVLSLLAARDNCRILPNRYADMVAHPS